MLTHREVICQAIDAIADNAVEMGVYADQLQDFDDPLGIVIAQKLLNQPIDPQLLAKLNTGQVTGGFLYTIRDNPSNYMTFAEAGTPISYHYSAIYNNYTVRLRTVLSDGMGGVFCGKADLNRVNVRFGEEMLIKKSELFHRHKNYEYLDRLPEFIEISMPSTDLLHQLASYLIIEKIEDTKRYINFKSQTHV